MSLAGQPDEAHLHAGLAKHDSLKDRYPRKQELRATMIPFDPTKFSSLEKPPGAGTLMGFSFDSLKPDGQVERAVSYRDGALSIMRTECGDWGLLQEQVSEEFEMLLPALGRGVEALVHERVDRFFWPEPRDTFRAADLFRPASRWLVPNVFQAETLWHSFHGLFEFLDLPEPHRLQHVVEVQTVPGTALALPPDGVAAVAEVKQNLTVVHGLKASGQEPATTLLIEELLGGGRGLAATYWHAVRTRADDVLAEIVNDEMCKEIGCGSQ